MSLTLDAILGNTSEVLEVIVEIDSAKRDDGTLKTWYYSTHPRETSGSQVPANTTFDPFLQLGGVLGPLSQSLSEDLLFSGLVSENPGSITLLQDNPSPDLLSSHNDYVFAGYEARIKIGIQSTDDYSSFEIIRTVTVAIDPVIQLTDNGLQSVFQFQSARKRMLEESLIIGRYVGIPTCAEVLTTSAVAQASYNAAHDLKSFTIVYRINLAALPAANRNLIAKISNATSNNFVLNLTTAGFVQCTVSLAGVAATLHTSANNLADSEWHTIVWGLLDKTETYLMIDGRIISFLDEADLPDSVDRPAVGVRMARFLVGRHSDVRLYNKYVPPDEAAGEFSVRSSGTEIGCVGCWRMDDGGSATAANDYSSTGADATWTGVLNTDYRWTFSDLGEPDIAGQSHPLSVGNVINARAHLIDSFRERYRGNTDSAGWYSSGSNSTLTVRSQGTVLTPTVDYSAPSNGGDGVFSMTSPEEEPITYSHLNFGTAVESVYASSIAHNILVNRTRIDSADILNYEPLRVLCPWPSGYHTEQESTAQDALAEILGQAGMYYVEHPSGALRFDMFIPPVGYGPYGEPAFDWHGQQNGVGFGDVGDITSSCTICGWVKINLADQTAYDFGSSIPNAGTMYIVAKQSTAGNYAVWFQAIGASAGKFAFTIASTTLSVVPGSIKPFTWYFFGCVFDDVANTMKIYLAPEGSSLIEADQVANSNSPSTNATSLVVGGGSQSSYNWFSAQHVQVYRSVKSISDLQALMVTPPTGSELDLAAYIPMNEGNGNPFEVVSNTEGTIFELGSIFPPIITPVWAPKLVVDLDETPSVKLVDFHHLHPASEIVVKYAKNRYVMSDSDIDSGVSQNDRLSLTSPGKEVRLELRDVKDRFKNAKKITLDTAITDQESAQKLLRSILYRFGTDCYIGTLQFPSGINISRLACGLEIGDEIGITGTIPSQLQTPRSFRVVAVSPNLLQLSTTVVFAG